MSIIDYFNPFNIEHIEAYTHLLKTGQWPVDFWSDDIELPSGWQISIMNKLANVWVDYMIDPSSICGT